MTDESEAKEFLSMLGFGIIALGILTAMGVFPCIIDELLCEAEVPLYVIIMGIILIIIGVIFLIEAFKSR